MGKHFRWVDRTDPGDRTDRIQVETDPDKFLGYDPDRMKPPVELSDEQVVVLSRYAVLEETEAPKESGDVTETPQTTDQTPKVYTREELEAMSAEDVKKIASDRNVQGRSNKNQEELVELILDHQQKGGE